MKISLYYSEHSYLEISKNPIFGVEKIYDVPDQLIKNMEEARSRAQDAEQAIFDFADQNDISIEGRY